METNRNVWGRSLHRLGVDVRHGEGRITLLLFLASFQTITFQYVAKTVRQSTFVDSLGAARLPWVYLLVALCSYPLLWLYVRSADRMSRHRLISVTCGLAAASMVVFWWLYAFDTVWVPALFYIWVSIVFATIVSQFWSFASHVLDARQAKRLLAFIGAGGLLGGIAGGQVARLATELVGTRHALLVAAVILLGVVATIHAVYRIHPDDEATTGATGMIDPAQARGGFRLIRDSRHLQLIAVVLVLGVMVAQIIDLQFNWAVERATDGLSERTAFYGNLFSIVGIAAFVFQLLFTARMHRTVGVGFSMRVLPLILALGTGLLLVSSGFFPELLIATALSLKVGESGLRYSLDQSTRELLFFPVPAGVRLRAKAYIDIFLQRSAKGLAALLLLPVTFGLITAVQAGWITLALIAVWLGVIAAAYNAYVTSFREVLKERTVDSAVPINLDDVKTVELLVQSLGSADSRQVLHSVEILDANGRGHLVPPLLLYHDEPEVRRRTLQVLAAENRRDAAPLIERRLCDESPEVRAEAIRVLTEFNAADACELMRPRLNEPDPRVKAAAVTCLVNHGDAAMQQAARRTLKSMLCDALSEERVEAIKAIGAINGTEFDGRLLEALYDRDASVAREAIRSVRRIVTRSGFNPLFVPTLISLLESRRLKFDAREALIAIGEDVIPILVHFMNDQGESILVRRALPKTLARIESTQAVPALVDALRTAEDALLRAQLVEALAAHRDGLDAAETRRKIELAIGAEAARYLERLTDVAALGEDQSLHYEAPLIRWDTRELNLLTQMVAERIGEHLKTIFGLLALIYPADDVWAAYRSLLSDRRSLRSHALEYLDNTLSGEVKRLVFAVIDDVPLADKLQLAARNFRIRAVGRTEAVARFLSHRTDEEADGPALSVAALYTVYTDRLTELYPDVPRLFAATPSPLVRETAEWVAGRLELDLPPRSSDNTA